MSLGHVYIVLEPVGSARLTFSDDRYYEFMCFDVPKVVQSPRSWTRRGVSEWPRHKDRYIGSLCLDIGMVPSEFRHILEYRGGGTLVQVERERQPGQAAPPPPLVRIGLGSGAAPEGVLD